ncbi:MAG: hypothetical protein WC043_06650 [Pseudobdellovibrionaceae bacterium]
MPTASASPLSKIYSRLIYRPLPQDILSHSSAAKPLYLITGASLTLYDPQKHGDEPTHATLHGGGERRNQTYLMNNGAATALELIKGGENVLLHSRDSLALRKALGEVANSRNLSIVGGDISVDQDAARLITSITDFAGNRSVSEVRMMAYQSFAQSSGQPFKTMINEESCEAERASSRRIRFVYNMAAIGYWLLEEQNQSALRVVSLSALAAHRPSFGLMADTSDKVMNEACWRTFHLEANHLTGKPINVVQINPGITTACDVYRGENMRSFLLEEAEADGFPMDRGIASIPQLSAHDIAEVASRMIRGDVGDDPNHKLPERIKMALYGGYSPDQLKSIFKHHVQCNEDGTIEFGMARKGPDHLYAAYTTYGKLPIISGNGYQRISLTPQGQTF